MHVRERNEEKRKEPGQNASFEKGLELAFEKIGQSRFSFKLDLGKESLGVLLHQLVENRLHRLPALVVYTLFCWRRLNRCVHRL